MSHQHQIAAALAMERGRGGVLDGHGRAQPRPWRRGFLRRGIGRKRLFQQAIVAGIGGRVALENDGRRHLALPITSQAADPAEEVVLLVVRQPDDLERMVALVQPVGVVINGLARPGEQSRGRVLFAEDQMRVGLAALQGDAHRHLAYGGAGQRIGSGQRLRAQQNVHPEGASLANQTVEQQGGVLGDAVVFHKKLLELVDHQQNPRHGIVRAGFSVGGQVLHALLAEDVAATFQLGVESLQHALPELPFALDGDDPRVRQFVFRIGLELHALFEVDQIQFDLVGAVPEGHVGDDRVHQVGFAGARFSGDQNVLGGAASQEQMLEFHGAGPPQRHVDAVGRVGRPPVFFLGRDEFEGHLDAVDVAQFFAHLAYDFREPLGRGRSVEHKRDVFQPRVFPDKTFVLPQQVNAVRIEVFEAEAVRHFRSRVDGHQRMHAASGAAGNNARQSPRGRLGEIGREIRHHQHAIGLGHLAGKLVVLLDRLELVAKVDLDDIFHVLGEVQQALVDMGAFGPNAVGN